MPRIRAAMLEQQRAIARDDNIVVEGRDIGTVVFPDAEVKIYLTAAPEERARRRAAQQVTTGVLVDPSGVKEALLRRDTADSSRKVAPLTAAEDAVVLDTTGLTIDDVIADIAGIVESRSL
jgi:cytidylate kinase